MDEPTLISTAYLNNLFEK